MAKLQKLVVLVTELSHKKLKTGFWLQYFKSYFKSYLLVTNPKVMLVAAVVTVPTEINPVIFGFPRLASPRCQVFRSKTIAGLLLSHLHGETIIIVLSSLFCSDLERLVVSGVTYRIPNQYGEMLRYSNGISYLNSPNHSQKLLRPIDMVTYYFFWLATDFLGVYVLNYYLKIIKKMWHECK